MKKFYKIVVVGLVTVFAVCLSASCGYHNERSQLDSASAFAHRGTANRLAAAYAKWIARHEKNGGDHNVVVNLGWSKSYSKKFTRARGRAKLDLTKGDVTIEVQGLDDQAISNVWLIDNQPGPGHSAAPDPADHLLWIGTLKHSEDRATLSVQLGDVFEDFDVDLVAITGSGKDPTIDGVLFGSVGLFQRLYTRARTGRLNVPGDSSSSPLGPLSPSPAYASTMFPTFDPLILKGADLFFNETFDGNGRTCGTCHPAENNFAIDPEFIATLPDRDPLFVAEFVPALKENFEKPELMRQLGLILENTNGFGDLKNNFTMRGVPHTLALGTSLTPAPGGADGTTTPPDERTGWSGDGAPGSGTLREFATGAVTQHFTKSLNRERGIDFRLPRDDELDAMEAFQLFLGRDADPDINAISFTNPVVSNGRDLFVTTDTNNGTEQAGKCSACHSNAGANVAAGANFNFDTGVENLPDTPGEVVTEAVEDPNLADVRPDDGFGNPGNGTFNTPPVVEAADTGPFFHNNSIETIEGAVEFYSSEAFDNSPAGQFLKNVLNGGDTGGFSIRLESTGVVAIAAFLRVLNVLENIRSAAESTKFALHVYKSRKANALIQLAIADVEDAIQVLDGGNLHPEAQRLLRRARFFLKLAVKKHFRPIQNKLLKKALNKIDRARETIAVSG